MENIGNQLNSRDCVLGEEQVGFIMTQAARQRYLAIARSGLAPNAVDVTERCHIGGRVTIHPVFRYQTKG